MLHLISSNVDDSINGFLHLGGVAELVGLVLVLFVLGGKPGALSWRVRNGSVLLQRGTGLVLQLRIGGLVVDLLVSELRDLILHLFYFIGLTLDFWAQSGRVIGERVVLGAAAKRLLERLVSSLLLLDGLQELVLPVAAQLLCPSSFLWLYWLIHNWINHFV